MVSFTTAIKNFYLKAFKFKGRATRAEFWWVELYYFLTILLLSFIISVDDSLIIILPIYILINAIPMLSLQVRRFHDIGKSAWSLFIYCIPYVGSFICLMLYTQSGDKFDNKYGKCPYETKAKVLDVENVEL